MEERLSRIGWYSRSLSQTAQASFRKQAALPRGTWISDVLALNRDLEQREGPLYHAQVAEVEVMVGGARR